MNPSRSLRLATILAFAGIMIPVPGTSLAQADVGLLRIGIWQGAADMSRMSAEYARDAKNTQGVYDNPRKAVDKLKSEFPEILKGAGDNEAVVAAVKSFYIAAQGCLEASADAKYIRDAACMKQKQASAVLKMELSLASPPKPKKNK